MQGGALLRHNHAATNRLSKTTSVFLCSLAKINCVNDCSKGRAYRAKVLKSVLQIRRDTRKSDSSQTEILPRIAIYAFHSSCSLYIDGRAVIFYSIPSAYKQMKCRSLSCWHSRNERYPLYMTPAILSNPARSFGREALGHIDCPSWSNLSQ